MRGTDVVELGCCFGFLSLRLAAAGHRVTAVDLCPGTARLLATVAPRLACTLNSAPLNSAPLNVVAGDAGAAPLAAGCAETVYAVHLLEHLLVAEGEAVLREALREARRRVVVAVPLEAEPNPTWGHVRTFDLDDMRELGASTGVTHQVSEHDGGWLVLDP